jgi:hypothetical protein
LLRQFW